MLIRPFARWLYCDLKISSGTLVTGKLISTCMYTVIVKIAIASDF